VLQYFIEKYTFNAHRQVKAEPFPLQTLRAYQNAYFNEISVAR
jgi:hypothetical protein